MKKSNVFCSVFFAMLLLMTLGCVHKAHAQCTPNAESISEFDFTYDVVNENAVTRIQFFLDYSAQNEIGAYGFQLNVALSSSIVGVSGVDYTLSGSWMFASTTASVDVDYDSGTHHVTFEVQRLDCKGTEGQGFIGEIIISRSSGSDGAVETMMGSIVMIDNVDAG